MYTPRLFRQDDQSTLFDFIDAYSFGALLVPVDGGAVDVAHLPFLLDRGEGPHGRLRCHVAKANPIWKHAAEGRAVTVLFAGPHAYISPRWYQHPGRQVPTWNYTAVHAHGRAGAPMSEADLRAALRDLADVNERGAAEPWSIDATEPGVIDGIVGGVAGITIHIERLEGKFKLSQNRSPEDQARVRRELAARGGETDVEMLRWWGPR